MRPRERNTRNITNPTKTSPCKREYTRPRGSHFELSARCAHVQKESPRKISPRRHRLTERAGTRDYVRVKGTQGKQGARPKPHRANAIACEYMWSHGVLHRPRRARSDSPCAFKWSAGGSLSCHVSQECFDEKIQPTDLKGDSGLSWENPQQKKIR